MTTIAALVLAAGSGTRLGERKQFLDLGTGERLVDRAIRTCRAHASWVGVVVPPDATASSFEAGDPSVDAVIAGGADRLASLRAGLEQLPHEATIVVVHSASHPLASVRIVEDLIAAVRDGADGAVPVLPAVDVIKRVGEAGSITTVGRTGLGAAQVPMGFAVDALRGALADGASPVEESMAVEAAGGTIQAVPGEITNVHVTDGTSLDLVRRWARTQDAAD